MSERMLDTPSSPGRHIPSIQAQPLGFRHQLNDRALKNRDIEIFRF